MAIPRFPQRRDVDLLQWSRGFRDRIVADPGGYGLSPAQAAAYSALHDDYAAAYAIARTPEGNSKAGIIAKNEARDRLLHGSSSDGGSAGGAWELVNFIQGNPATTNEMRGELGLRIAKEPAAVARPVSAPVMSIVMMQGRVAKVRLRDGEHPDRRGKPAGVRGATVLYFVGGPHETEPPADLHEWRFAENVSKPVFNLSLPWQATAGHRIWLTAFWFNDKMQAGPAATPKEVYGCASFGTLALAA